MLILLWFAAVVEKTLAANLQECAEKNVTLKDLMESVPKWLPNWYALAKAVPKADSVLLSWLQCIWKDWSVLQEEEASGLTSRRPHAGRGSDLRGIEKAMDDLSEALKKRMGS